MLVPNRTASSTAYRYGFQGQEKDDEIKGEGNSLNYKYRMHDPRVGRFFAVDPLTKKYPHYTPYSFSGNKVIAWGEIEGLEEGFVIDGGNITRVEGPVAGSFDSEQAAFNSKFSSEVKHKSQPAGQATMRADTRTYGQKESQRLKIEDGVRKKEMYKQVFTNPGMQIAHGVYVGVPEGLLEVSGMKAFDMAIDGYKAFKVYKQSRMIKKSFVFNGQNIKTPFASVETLSQTTLNSAEDIYGGGVQLFKGKSYNPSDWLPKSYRSTILYQKGLTNDVNYLSTFKFANGSPAPNGGFTLSNKGAAALFAIDVGGLSAGLYQLDFNKKKSQENLRRSIFSSKKKKKDN